MHIVRLINGALGKVFGIEIKKTQTTLLEKIVQRRRTTPLLDFVQFPVDDYIEELRDVYRKNTAAPKFLDNKKKPRSLHIGINSYVKKIRLKLPAENYLHLHSIILLGTDGKPLNLAQSAQISISSQSDTFDKLSDDEHRQRLFSPEGKHAYAFYTEYEHAPWLVINFPTKRYIGGLVINNRAGVNALRATGLTVEISRNPPKWKTVYALNDLRVFQAAAERITEKYELSRYELGKDFAHFVSLLLIGNGTASKDLYKQMPEQHRPTIRDAVNKLILHERDMEMISHGPRRTFRYWTNERKQKLLRATMQVIKDLQDLSPDACLGFGSVLAVVRDQDLLPHDNDTDIVVALKPSQATTIDDAMRQVKKHLESKGYTVDDEMFSGWNVRRDGCKVDVFVSVYEKDGTVGWYPGPRGILKRSDLFPAKKTTLLGVECTIPKDAEKYLQVTYGKKWQTPDPGHVHSWDTSAYTDLKGA